MKIPSLLFICGLLLGADVPAYSASTACHFHRDIVPRDEARILALAGVMPQWKCDYELSPQGGKSNVTFILFAEVYSGPACTARHRLALAVADPAESLRGIISVGWKQAEHHLTGVVDNGQFYSPWTEGAVKLPQISPVDGHFFETSPPETRHAQGSSFVIFPVLGIRGSSSLKSSCADSVSAPDFLKRCWESGAKNAVVIYLYEGPGDPPLAFTK
jgi:hypothetical protein